MSWWYLLHSLLLKTGYEMVFLVLQNPANKDTPFIIKNVYTCPEDLNRHSGDCFNYYGDEWIVPAIKLRRNK